MSKKRTTPKDSTPKLIIKDTLNRVADDTLIFTRTLIKPTATSETLYKLVKISVEDLAQKRKSKIAGLIFKINDAYFFTEIPSTMHFFSFDGCGKHLCADCGRLSALSDAEGGCRKVRDARKRIERYTFVSFGYETFGTVQDVFVVFACNNFREVKPRKALSFSEANALKKSLKDFYEDNEFFHEI